MKKKWCILLAFCLFLVGCDFTETTEKPDSDGDTSNDESKNIKIEILEMNDIHGHIENEGNYGGLGRANTLINNIRKETKEDNTILIGNGDMLQETAIARVGYGKVVIDAMNEMKFDMMGVGNHEFDWGFDKFLSYFDGDSSNGEANFPLVNSNVYYKDALVTQSSKVCESYLIQKENVKVGILSYIGDVYSSINTNMSLNYSFKARDSEISESVSKLGQALKDQGADILIVNIHGGESSSCEDYEPNQRLAKLKYKDKYLVDAVINGHTHTRQDSKIKRSNGADLPVVQSSGKLADFGRIDLTYNCKDKEVTNVKVSHVRTKSASSTDSKVDQIIQAHYEKNKDILEEIYCENNAYIDRYDAVFHYYISKVMMAATGATAAICNMGAFRNDVPVGPFDFNALYSLNPFDNHIILCEISGMDLKRFYDVNHDKEIVDTSDYGSYIATDKTYKLAIIDYVYFGNYFAGYRTEEYVDTGLVLRDLLAMDLRLRTEDGFTLSRDYANILLSKVDFS